MNKRKSATFDSDSRNHQQMAFFQLTFQSPVSKDSRCSLCSELMRDAVYTTCCESFFCQECISRVLTARRPCPKCARSKFDTANDNKTRAMRSKINMLRVFCPMSKNGCKWIGPLEGLDHHLKYGETNFGSGACQFLSVECPNKCGTHVARGDIPKHLRDLCTQRKISCQYCGFTDTHDHVTAVHYSSCTLYPVDCPNGCKMPRVQRKEVKDHVDNHCPLRTIQCEFEFAGCPSEFRATNESRHMEERTTYHLSMLSTYCRSLSEDNDALRNLCYGLQESLAGLQSELSYQKSTLKQTQIDLWSLKLKLPQPLPVDVEGEEELPPTSSTSIPLRKTCERIYSEPNTFTVRNYAYGYHGDNYVTPNKTSLSSSGFASLNELDDEGSEVEPLPRISSVPSLKSHTFPGYDKPRIRHQSSPPEPAKLVKPVLSPPIPELLEPCDPADSPPIEIATGNPDKPVKPVKPETLPRQVIPPPVPQRPVKYANMVVANGNGTDDVMKRAASAHTLTGSIRSIPDELQDVFSTAETPIGSCNKESETEDP